MQTRKATPSSASIRRRAGLVLGSAILATLLAGCASPSDMALSQAREILRNQFVELSGSLKDLRPEADTGEAIVDAIRGGNLGIGEVVQLSPQFTPPAAPFVLIMDVASTPDSARLNAVFEAYGESQQGIVYKQAIVYACLSAVVRGGDHGTVKWADTSCPKQLAPALQGRTDARRATLQELEAKSAAGRNSMGRLAGPNPS